MKSLQWKNGELCLLDQTLLPNQIDYIYCRDYLTVAEAIKKLQVRGAPAIGAAAAFGIVLGANEAAKNVTSDREFRRIVADVASTLRQTRPTAVNLFWAIKRMLGVLDKFAVGSDVGKMLEKLEQEAILIAQEDEQVNANISVNGALLFTQPVSILTHCNAGALATVAYGTALGVIREAHRQGHIDRVFADETRPLLQGARLTAWELMQDNIPVTLITDNMAGWVMKQSLVQAVIVGADRIALNGDVANKIGTYSVAVLAKEHNIPFYVAAPLSTFDIKIASGDGIPIEERDRMEVLQLAGINTAPEEVSVYNPAFDVTPSNLISAIITEVGVLRPPFSEKIRQIFQLKG